MKSCWKKPKKTDPEIEIGDVIEEPMESVEFGRIAAQTAKQVILQKVREAEREQVVEMFEDRVGEVLSGIVKRVERGHVFIDVGSGIEAIVPREHGIPREKVKRGDRVERIADRSQPPEPWTDPDLVQKESGFYD